MGVENEENLADKVTRYQCIYRYNYDTPNIYIYINYVLKVMSSEVLFTQ